MTRDVRYGLRGLVASPRFTVVALLTIVIMVGGITTIFTLVQTVLLRPLPYPDDHRLAMIESTQSNLFGTMPELADVTRFRERSRSFDLWGLYRPGYVESLPVANSEPLSVQDLLVTPDVFPMFAIDIAMGRPLLPSDVNQGAPDVVVISHELWQRLFAGDPDVIGKTLNMRWGAFAVVGVTPPGANVPMNWLPMPIVWRPLRDDADASMRFHTVARLREDVSIAGARSELAVLAEGLAAERPDTHKGRIATVTLLLDRIVGDFKRVLWIFFSAVVCVLLIGAANLVSLQLARNSAREREIVVRTAIGASRWQVVRQLLVEALLLCGIGGALGLATAWWSVQLVIARLPSSFPRIDQIGVNPVVALFACGIALVVGLAVGTLPAWHASRVDAARLSDGGRPATGSRGRSRTQRALIAFQTAVALILLVGAGLLANSFYRLISRDAGMKEDGLWTVRATLPSRYRDNAAQASFWTSALEQVRGVNGVQSAAVSVNSTGPLSGSDISEGGIVREGVPPPTNRRDGLSASSRRVSHEYFHTLGMPLLKGRPILASDVEGAETVVVINEMAAVALWPGQDAIGKRLRSRNVLKTVVGVIPTFRHRRLDGELSAQIYSSYLQQPSVASSAVIMIRFTPGVAPPITAVTSALTGLEKELRISVNSMADVRWNLLATERFRATLLLAFAGTAVFLALVGIVGLVIYTVGQRQREIAVRVALGAVQRDILRVASRQAVAPAFIGLALGVVGASMATRLLSSYLVDIQPIDLPTFAAALGVLAAAAMGAGVIPARQALRIDPVDALRSE